MRRRSMVKGHLTWYQGRPMGRARIFQLMVAGTPCTLGVSLGSAYALAVAPQLRCFVGL
jgi:hypothetical protein